MGAVGLDSTPNPHRPIPQAVLKIQFKRLLSQHNENSVIFTRDLLTVIDQYEKEHSVLLLTPDQKDAIRPYCLANPDLEMSADDILNLLKLVFPQTTTTTRSSERPKSIRRDSTYFDQGAQDIVEQKHQQDEYPNTRADEPMDIVSPPEDSDQEDMDRNSVAQYYRRSIELTRRLKISERSLATMTRDNEDRIVQLQNRVDDMNQEVVKQRREISEYKNKEKNSLEQISTLEAHIARIERSESAQKQVYQSIRKLFDEKCQETQELQEMLRRKEKELENTEALLSAVHREFQQLYEERNRLMKLQQELERELATSHYTHMQLAEQRSENERLKGIIDGLKCDLESRNENQDGVVPGDVETYSLVNTLQAELESHIGYSDPYLDTEERLKSVEYEKDYYKTRANEAMEDLDRVNQELASSKRALEQENKSLVNQLADLQMKMPAESKENVGYSSGREAGLAGFPPSSNDTTIEIDDVWTQSRLRQRKFEKNRKRGVQDLNESTANMIYTESDGSDTRVVTRSNDRAVTNTATFAIYTLLVYIFGIVTSTFLLETAQPGSWEQALLAAATQQGGSRSKILEIIICWIEKLLFEGDGMSL